MLARILAMLKSRQCFTCIGIELLRFRSKLYWSLPPPMEKLGEAAADPARIDGRFTERDAGAERPDKVSDHNAQNQTGACDRDQSDYQNERGHRVCEPPLEMQIAITKPNPIRR
jgi:hypothetical protein